MSMLHHDDDGRMASLGTSATLAGYARLLTIVASILGPIFLGIGSWAAGQAYTAFDQQRQKLDDIRLTLTTLSAQRLSSDASLAAVQHAVEAHDNRLLDHEKRITRVEALTPLTPLR